MTQCDFHPAPSKNSDAHRRTQMHTDAHRHTDERRSMQTNTDAHRQKQGKLRLVCGRSNLKTRPDDRRLFKDFRDVLYAKYLSGDATQSVSHAAIFLCQFLLHCKNTLDVVDINHLLVQTTLLLSVFHQSALFVGDCEFDKGRLC